MDVIYFIKEGETARRVDSAMVEPMRNAGYTILRMPMDGKNIITELKPDEEMPEGFLQESRYGMVMIFRDEENEQKKAEISQQQQLDKQAKEIEELKKAIEELQKGGSKK